MASFGLINHVALKSVDKLGQSYRWITSVKPKRANYKIATKLGKIVFPFQMHGFEIIINMLAFVGNEKIFV